MIKLGTHIFCSALFTLMLLACAGQVQKVSVLDMIEGSEWHYLTGRSQPPDNWNKRGADMSGWQKGQSGFGYGPGRHNTLLNDMRGSYRDVYVRLEFPVSDYRKITRMTLSLFCDGPFVAYLNGIEAIRSRRPQSGDPLDLIGFAHELDTGINVVAITCRNDDINSEDFSFIPYFSLHEELPSGDEMPSHYQTGSSH